MTLSAYFDRLEVPTRTVTVYAPPPRPAIVDRIASETGVDAVDYRSLPAAAATDPGFLVVREGERSESSEMRAGDAESERSEDSDDASGATASEKRHASREGERSESSEARAGAKRHASREDETFVVAVGLEAVREFLEPPIVDPWADADAAGDDVDGTYRRVIDAFESTVWRALDRRQLLAISREIESRAWRVGSGTLRVGFQRSAALEAMAPVYVRLAGETELDVRVYVADDWDRPSIPGVTVSDDAGPEIGSFWFLAFDGGGDELRTGGLVARECDADAGAGTGTYEGYWTDDPDRVAQLEQAIRESVDGD